MLPSDIPQVKFQEIVTELVKVQMKRRLPWQTMYDMKFYETAAEALATELVATLVVYLQGKNHHHDEEKMVMSYPETWWEHFKEAWFSDWLKKKFPVKYKKVWVPVAYKLTKLCPHLHTDKEQQHLRWLLTPDFDDMKDRFK